MRLLPRASRKPKTVPLAVAKHGTAAYRNAAKHSVYLYVELRPISRTVEYTLRVTAAQR
jgi:hypothetical protein